MPVFYNYIIQYGTIQYYCVHHYRRKVLSCSSPTTCKNTLRITLCSNFLLYSLRTGDVLGKQIFTSMHLLRQFGFAIKLWGGRTVPVRPSGRVTVLLNTLAPTLEKPIFITGFRCALKRGSARFTYTLGLEGRVLDRSR